MADAIVSVLIERVADALVQEAVFLHGVNKQVERLQDEFKWMQCFLKDAAAKQDGDERVRLWVAEIRDLSFRAEDVIDTFIFRVASKKRGRPRTFFKRCAYIFTELLQRHKTRAEIEDIYARIRDTTRRVQLYGVKNIGEGEGTSNTNRMRQLRRSYHHFKEDDVVGLENDIKKMVAQLTSVEKKYRVISIVGMGGSGKTTLAKEVYNHEAVKTAFDCCSWVYVSQECKPRDIFTSILKNVSSLYRETQEKMKEEELAEKLYEILKVKRYLMVLDDIWSEDAWDRLKPAFPNRKMGSKILLTTRNEEVPLHADPRSPRHVPRRLTDDESWILLCKKAFPEDDITSCGDFENLGREMIRKCDNLPLAIVVLGGLLATKSTLDQWKMVHRNVTRHLYKRQQQQGVMDILALSYHNLPSRLKPCFLYLGIYPEDFHIRARELILLWIAEGFIPKPPPPSQETIEDVAEEWLEELAHRCMIQISERGSTRSIKYCCVHDLMRDLCLSKAREEKFLEVLITSKCSESNGSSSSIARKSRRSAIHYSGNERYVPVEQLDSNVRSLFLTSLDHSISLKIEQAKPIFMNYHLIRVLDLPGVEIEGRTLPREIGNLINLRYLSLYDSNIEEFPPSLGNLSNMQTLNIRTLFGDVTVPDVIWKMDKLRHLVLPRSLVNENLRLETLIALQTLKGVPCKFFMEKSAANLTNLNRLVIDPISTEELDAFLESPVLEHIYSLSLNAKTDDYYQFLDLKQWNLKRLSSCHNLSNLCVDGEISKLAQNDFLPPNLAKLKLYRTRLEQDPMPALGNLFNLRILCLYADAYIGKEMICTSKAFPKLESLVLCTLHELEELRVEEGAMPCLRRLQIDECRKLRMIPEGLRFITTLQELEIFRMPKAFGNRIRVVEGKGGEDLYKVQHIPSIQIIDERE